MLQLVNWMVGVKMKKKSYFGFMFLAIILIPIASVAALLREVSALVIYIEIFIILLLMGRNLTKMCTAKQRQVYFILFLIRMGLLLYQSTYGNLPMSGGDSAVFHENAMNILNYSGGDILKIFNPPSIMVNRGDYFERLVALIYYLCGARTQYIYYFSYIASELVFYYINKTAKLLSGDSYIAAKTAIFFYIWPLEIIYSVDYLREMTMQCVFAMSLYSFLLYLVKKKNGRIIPALILAYICVGIHSGMVGILAAYGFVIIFYNRRIQRMEFSSTKMFLVLVIVMGFMVSPLWNEVMGRFSQIDSMADLGNRVKSNTVMANTDYISSPTSNIGIIAQTPIRLFYFMVSPLFWQVRSVGTIIAMILDGIPRVYLVYSVYKNWRRREQLSNKNRAVFIGMLMIVLCSHLIFSWGTNNYGTAMRHRTKVFPAEIILFSVFKVQFMKEKENERIQI